MLSDVLADVVVDAGRQGQVEEAVGVRSPRQRQQVGVKSGEGALVCVLPTHVGVTAEERGQTLHLSVCHLGRGEEKTDEGYRPVLYALHSSVQGEHVTFR